MIRLDQVQKKYRMDKGKKNALCSISLQIQEGEFFSLLGINGAGKTTLSSIIATLIKPSKGQIFFKNESIYNNLIEYRKILGFCPQHCNLDPFITLEQNLTFSASYYNIPQKEIEYRKEELLEKFNLKEYRNEQCEILSGGFRQRFLLARTLMHKPKFVILDEPTMGLDPQARNKLIEDLHFMKEENITLLYTTHYLEEAEKLSDRICVINNGKILVIDSPENLKQEWKKQNLTEVFLHLINQEREEKECE